MKLLIADAFSETHLSAFAQLGLDVDYRPQLSAAELPQAIGQVRILVVRSTRVTAETICAGTALGLIVRAGAGVNTIDLEAASQKGIFVTNCPGQNSIAVAELTLGWLLALDRRLPDQVEKLRAGQWNKKEFSKASGLYGRSLGVIGLGAIGQAVVARARAFGMKVVAWSRSLTAEKAAHLGVERAETIPALCAACDAVSVHVAYVPGTRGLVGDAAFSRMRKGAIFINTSRAEVVDHDALRQAIADKKLREALDEFPGEPDKAEAPFAEPLLSLVYGSHHVGASTDQAQMAIADETLRIVESFLQDGTVRNCVNILPPEQTPARAELIVRHYDKVGVLAQLLSEVRRHNINVETMQNTVFLGAQAACARIRLGTRPPAELVATIRKQPDIIFVDVVELPET